MLNGACPTAETVHLEGSAGLRERMGTGNPGTKSGAAMKTIPWDNIRALKRRIDREGTPREISAIKREIAAAERNVEALRVLFGGQICQGSVDEYVRLRFELDDTYGRLALQEVA